MIVASEAEAEYGALYENSKLLIPMRNTLEQLGHSQKRTSICVDNSTDLGLAQDTLKQKRSKSMDMRFHWLRDRDCQEQLQYFGNPPMKIGLITLQKII